MSASTTNYKTINPEARITRSREDSRTVRFLVISRSLIFTSSEFGWIEPFVSDAATFILPRVLGVISNLRESNFYLILVMCGLDTTHCQKDLEPLTSQEIGCPTEKVKKFSWRRTHVSLDMSYVVQPFIVFKTKKTYNFCYYYDCSFAHYKLLL